MVFRMATFLFVPEPVSFRTASCCGVTCILLLPSTRLSCTVQTRAQRKVVALWCKLRIINIRDFVELCVLMQALFSGPWLCLRGHWNLMLADPPSGSSPLPGITPDRRILEFELGDRLSTAFTVILSTTADWHKFADKVPQIPG